jgi:hypothetical protein
VPGFRDNQKHTGVAYCRDLKCRLTISPCPCHLAMQDNGTSDIHSADICDSMSARPNHQGSQRRSCWPVRFEPGGSRRAAASHLLDLPPDQDRGPALLGSGVGPRQLPATSAILFHESVFSGLRASFVKRQAFKPLNRCAPFKPFKPTSALRVQSSNTLYPAAVKSILDFGFRPNHRSNPRNHFAMRAPFFVLHLLNKVQIANSNCFDHRASRTAKSSRRAISTHWR